MYNYKNNCFYKMKAIYYTRTIDSILGSHPSHVFKFTYAHPIHLCKKKCLFYVDHLLIFDTLTSASTRFKIHIISFSYIPDCI